MNETKIKKEAKEIMDNFMNALSDIDIEEEFVLERKNTTRNEKKGKKVDENFKQKFLSNAPKIKGDAILANKGTWVK
ncbi:MAG: hypothetical protein KC589_04880 [Nanoarchaeota archaeon]|nr:hypothetical protein [Nanoarchaeota archaeon]